jgi:hypothetical protein
VRALAIAIAFLATACSDLMPTTSRVVPTRAIAPPSDAALVVFERPWPMDDGAHAGMWSYVRIVDDDERVLCDLGYGEHCVVRRGAGAQTFYAYNWATHTQDPVPCVGAMPATLAVARVYVATLEERPGAHRKRCRPIELVRVPANEHAAHWPWLRGSKREEMIPNREKSIFVDAPWMAEWHVKKGRWRMADDPDWSPKASTLAIEDGSPSLP